MRGMAGEQVGICLGPNADRPMLGFEPAPPIRNMDNSPLDYELHYNSTP